MALFYRECLANSFIIENIPLDKIISCAREQNDNLVRKMNMKKKRERRECGRKEIEIK